MMYSLNIGGVKRWLTLANEENSEHHSKSQFYRHTTHFLEEKRKSEEEADETRQVASTDTFLSPVSTPGYVPSESLSKQHLDSFISSADKKEYNTYLSQFDPDAPSWTLGRVLDSSSTKKMASHPDLSIFESHISANDDDYKSLFEYGDTGSGDESAAVSYEEEFALYADMALKTQRLLPSKSDASRYSGYRQWIQEGVYTKIK